MKTAFIKTLTHIASQDPRTILITADLGFQIFDDFRAQFGKRYINVGVAEAEMILAASGLASEGWHPVTYSISSFATGRAYEQIRLSVSYPRLPIIMVGVGGGYGYSHSGITHHAVDDFALMSALPGMTIVSPGDAFEVTELLPQLSRLRSPSYLRIGRGGEPGYHSKSPVTLGRARLLRDGEKISILSTGEVASVVMDALDILKKERIFPIAYQMHTIKPLDVTMLEELKTKAHTIITIEEHLPSGGLFSVMNAWQASSSGSPRLLRLGPPDELALGNFSIDDLRRRFGYDAKSLSDLCRLAWSYKG